MLGAGRKRQIKHKSRGSWPGKTRYYVDGSTENKLWRNAVIVWRSQSMLLDRKISFGSLECGLMKVCP
jgi:hypothetical protein